MIYYDDHMPPHFHAKYNEFEALYSIRPIIRLRGTLPNKQHKRVIEWASKNQNFLTQKWNQFNP